MQILDYEYKAPDWEFNRIRFQKINMVVGDSGAGKTRLLNTIFNLGTYVVQGKPGSEGEWDLSLGIEDNIYRWTISRDLPEGIDGFQYRYSWHIQRMES